MADLVADFKRLRLYGMAACYAEGLEQGQSAMTTATALLTQLVQAEATDRATRSIRYQMHVARFPVHRDLAGFDFDQAKVDRRTDAICHRTGLDPRQEQGHVCIAGHGRGQPAAVLMEREGDHDDFHGARRRMADVIAEAVCDAGVPHVVMLSAIAAALPEGSGPAKDLHYCESQLGRATPRLTALRSCYFQDNVAAVLPAARQAGIYPNLLAAADIPIPMVATTDVGREAANAPALPTWLPGDEFRAAREKSGGAGPAVKRIGPGSPRHHCPPPRPTLYPARPGGA